MHMIMLQISTYVTQMQGAQIKGIVRQLEG